MKRKTTLPVRAALLALCLLPAAASAGAAYDSWKASHSVVDDNADPDSDGFTNLQEYAFGLDPNAANRPEEGAVYTIENGHIGITFPAPRRSSEATQEIVYQIECLNELTNTWENKTASDGSGSLGFFPPPAGDDGEQLVSISIQFTEASGFLRLRVRLNDA